MKRTWVWAAATLLLAACQSTEPVVVDNGPRMLVASSLYPTGNPHTAALRYMGDLIQKETNGRILVELHTSMELGGVAKTIQGLREGTVAISELPAPVLGDVAKSFRVFTLPYLFRDRLHMFSVLDGPLGDELLGDLQDGGIVGLGFLDDGARSVFTSTGPVRSPGDLKAVRIRSLGSGLPTDLLTAMGAVGIPMPLGELKAALDSGQVQGAELDPSAYEVGRYFENARFYSLTEHGRAPAVLLVSKAVWNRLSEGDRDLVRRAGRRAVQKQRSLWVERESRIFSHLLGEGVEVILDVDRAAFAEATARLREETARQFGVANLLRRIQGLAAPTARARDPQAGG